MSETIESAQQIASRMDEQRRLLQRQFAKRPSPPEQTTAVVEASADMHAYEPRSYLMRLLISNPQLLQRAAMVAVTTALGARYSSWALRLGGLLWAARKRAAAG